MNKSKYFIWRISQMCIVVFLVFTFIFLLFNVMSGSYTSLMVGRGLSPEAIQAFEERWGLNQPLHKQYIQYIINIVQLDAGHSLEHRQPVVEFVSDKLFNSFILIAPAVTFAYIIGAGIGLFLGSKSGSATDQYGIIPVIMAGTMPEFFTSILLILIFASYLGIFPSGGIASVEHQLSGESIYLSPDFAMHYILPFTAVVLRYLFLPVLIMRTNVVQALEEDFFKYHKLTGLTKRLRYKHLARYSILPVITLYPISLSRSIGGLVLIEVVFNWPGIGYWLVRSVVVRDWPVAQFIFILVAIWIVVGNFLVDILYTFIDPRITIGD